MSYLFTISHQKNSTSSNSTQKIIPQNFKKLNSFFSIQKIGNQFYA